MNQVVSFITEKLHYFTTSSLGEDPWKEEGLQAKQKSEFVLYNWLVFIELFFPLALSAIRNLKLTPSPLSSE